MEIVEIIASLASVFGGSSGGDEPTPPGMQLVFLIFGLVILFVCIIASVVGRS
jgi:hypothetical protein